MIELSDFHDFRGIIPKKIDVSIQQALNDFQFRSLTKAKETILKNGKYDENSLKFIIDSILKEAVIRKYILQELKGKKPITLKKATEILGIPSNRVIYEILNLKDKGFIEEVDEKRVQGGTAKLYKVIDDTEKIWENYFKPVEIFANQGSCNRCGLCSSICPVDAIKFTEDYLYIDESKCITCGLCYSFCPNSFRLDPLYNSSKKSDRYLKHSKNFGYYYKISSGKTQISELMDKGQDGGVVTSLLYYLLDKKLVDAVVTVKHSRNYWKPKISIVKNKNYLTNASGTIYAHVPILSILNKVKQFNKVAIVALPCQIRAITRGIESPIKLPIFSNIKYKIGLFCMKSFTYERILTLIQEKFNITLDEITKMDIKKGRFILHLINGNTISTSLKNCSEYTSNYCQQCYDATSELADISVGAIGSKVGWSTVIMRTKKGQDLFIGAVKDRLIKTNNLMDITNCQSLVDKIAMKKKENYIQIELGIK
ncbi:MAG: 4Fe-4S dicluster domain-containing protein [Promethearchaeota archaeon]|nr:MAG: 4Fe-4S dicluster domain-containing protein [Candidatus Lokiarchaeota archaeon]